jgi:hypothetical protein
MSVSRAIEQGLEVHFGSAPVCPPLESNEPGREDVW